MSRILEDAIFDPDQGVCRREQLDDDSNYGKQVEAGTE